VHWHRIDVIAQADFTMRRIDRRYLAAGIGWRSCHSNSYIASENVMVGGVQHGIYINSLAFLKRKLRGLSSVMEDVSPLIKCHFPATAAENVDHHAIADTIHIPNDPSNQRGTAGREWWRIEDGVMAARRQAA
jgi:hypothetical protein